MDSLAHLFKAQRPALDKLIALIRVDQIDQILAQGSEELIARHESFMHYETTLIGQVHDPVA